MKKWMWASLFLLISVLGLFGIMKAQQARQYSEIKDAVSAQLPPLNSIVPERITRPCHDSGTTSRNCTLLRYEVTKQQCLEIQEQLGLQKENCSAKLQMTNKGQDFSVQSGGIYEELARQGLYVNVYSTKNYLFSDWL